MVFFFNCFQLKGELILPEKITSIGNNAFYNCFVFTGNLIIPNSVTIIGESSFYIFKDHLKKY